MTKTFTTLVSYRSVKTALSVMIQLGTAVDILFLWNKVTLSPATYREQKYYRDPWRL